MKFFLALIFFFCIFKFAAGQNDVWDNVNQGIKQALISLNNLVVAVSEPLKKVSDAIRNSMCPRLSGVIHLSPEAAENPLQVALTEVVNSVRHIMAKKICIEND